MHPLHTKGEIRIDWAMDAYNLRKQSYIRNRISGKIFYWFQSCLD